jgi:hypothetical protein
MDKNILIIGAIAIGAVVLLPQVKQVAQSAATASTTIANDLPWYAAAYGIVNTAEYWLPQVVETGLAFL